jgi:riboflavin kinase, archaea type
VARRPRYRVINGEFVQLTGVIFSDLGQASFFMGLDWVQELLVQRLGYHPFPATLNVRPKGAADAEVWRRVQRDVPATQLTTAGEHHCGAKLYRVDVRVPTRSDRVDGAVLLPEINDYPPDKIEIVAPMRLKDHFGVGDGDQLTLEFIH